MHSFPRLLAVSLLIVAPVISLASSNTNERLLRVKAGRHSITYPATAAPAAAGFADYATYIADNFTYSVTALATDSIGNTYFTGGRAVTGPVVSGGNPLLDVFVTKLDSAGNLIVTFTLSGKGSDRANGIAVDGSGNIWVAGQTSSPDFPLRNPLQSSPGAGPGGFPGLPGQTGFLTKLGPDGAILFSSYLGGYQGTSALNAVAVDAAGNAYVTGTAFASDYPRTPGLPADFAALGIGGISVAFFAEISAAGDKIVYAGGVAGEAHACGAGSSCFLSPLLSSGESIAVDAAGNAYIAGNTNGAGLPTTPGALRTDGIGAFVMKVNAAGAGLAYLTLLGSANYIPPGAAPASNPGNTVAAIAVDGQGNAYITGLTSDPNFPATGSTLQPGFSIPSTQINPFSAPPSDAFVAKLNPTGSAMVWATFLGGSGGDQGRTIAADPSGNVWVSGITSSSDFPVSAGFPKGPEFLVEINSSGSALSYGSRLPENSIGAAIALDASGRLDAAGLTGIASTFTPAAASAPRVLGIGNAAGGILAGRIAPAELISIYGINFGVGTPVQASFSSAGFLPTTLGGIQVIIGGTLAPLLYVSGTQINAVAPIELTSPGAVDVQVVVQGTPLSPFRCVVDPAAPQVFRTSGGFAAAINQDGTVNSAANPAPAGTIVAVWATGVGGLLADGQQAVAAQPGCSCSVEDVNSGSLLSVLYAGAAPGLVNGVTQINFQMPSPAAGSSLSFVLSDGGKTGDPTYVYVK